MDKIEAIKDRKERTAKRSRITRNSKIFKTIIKAAQEKKGERIVSLDLKKIPEAISDFFVICEASNPIQLKSIADFIRSEVKNECGEIPYSESGRGSEYWILLDYVDIVVHVMMEETRNFYRLEEMWSDASLKEHLD